MNKRLIKFMCLVLSASMLSGCILPRKRSSSSSNSSDNTSSESSSGGSSSSSGSSSQSGSSSSSSSQGGGGEETPEIHAGWPTEVLAELTSTYGLTVPQPASGTFSWYEQDGAIYAYTETSTEMVNDYYDALEANNFMVDYASYYYYMNGLLDCVMAYPWEETVEVDFADEYDENDTVTSFYVAVGLTTPFSTFSSTWPSTAVSEFLEDDAPEVPSADKVSVKDFKYAVEEDDSGTYLHISAIDNNTPGVDAIEDTYVAKFGEGWTVDSSTYDEDGYIVTDSEDKVKVQFYSYNGTFDAFIYNLSGSTPIDVGDTVTITPNDVPDSYDSPAAERTICGLTMMVCNVMKNASLIQLKKNSVNMYNTVAYDPMASLVFEGTNKQDNFTVYAGSSSSSLTEVTPSISGTTLTYNMNGATFFKVQNGSGVFTCSSITFGFSE